MTTSALLTSSPAYSHVYRIKHDIALTARETTVTDGGGRVTGRLGEQQGGRTAR